MQAWAPSMARRMSVLAARTFSARQSLSHGYLQGCAAERKGCGPLLLPYVRWLTVLQGGVRMTMPYLRALMLSSRVRQFTSLRRSPCARS
eukprot:12223171-Alexandrium_andersonii.AAC.1